SGGVASMDSQTSTDESGGFGADHYAEFGRDCGATAEIALLLCSGFIMGSQALRRSSETKKPSVSVVRGVSRTPSAARRAALPNMKARSPNALMTSAPAAAENSGYRARKPRICAPFSSSRTEQVTYAMRPP